MAGHAEVWHCPQGKDTWAHRSGQDVGTQHTAAYYEYVLALRLEARLSAQRKGYHLNTHTAADEVLSAEKYTHLYPHFNPKPGASRRPAAKAGKQNAVANHRGVQYCQTNRKDVNFGGGCCLETASSHYVAHTGAIPTPSLMSPLHLNHSRNPNKPQQHSNRTTTTTWDFPDSNNKVYLS